MSPRRWPSCRSVPNHGSAAASRQIARPRIPHLRDILQGRRQGRRGTHDRPPRNLYERRGLIEPSFRGERIEPGIRTGLRQCKPSNWLKQGRSGRCIAADFGLYRNNRPRKSKEQRHDPDRRRTRHKPHALAARPPKGPLAAARPLLHRRRLDRHPGQSRDQSGQRRRAGQSAEARHRGSNAGGRGRRARVSGLGQAHRQATLQYPAQMVRPDHRQPRGSRADPDVRAGQAAGRSARRGRYRRRLCRVLRRGGAPRLWRNHSDPAARRAAAGDPPADRRCGAITPWNFPAR